MSKTRKSYALVCGGIILSAASVSCSTSPTPSAATSATASPTTTAPAQSTTERSTTTTTPSFATWRVPLTEPLAAVQADLVAWSAMVGIIKRTLDLTGDPQSLLAKMADDADSMVGAIDAAGEPPSDKTQVAQLRSKLETYASNARTLSKCAKATSCIQEARANSEAIDALSPNLRVVLTL